MSQSRQLAAIMFTDIVGYTAMMQQDEHKAVAVIKHYNVALEKWVKHYNGSVLNYYGDGSLCIFPTAIDATNCSLEVQKDLKKEPLVPLRIGLHIGEVFFEDGKALGDGVNVASRIQSLGQENSILVSAEFYDKIKNNTTISTKSLGSFVFKNVEKPMEVYALANEGLFVPQRKNVTGKLKEEGFFRKNFMIPISLILIAIISFIVYKNFLPKAEQVLEIEKSIAVLPFVDLSRDKDQEYLGDGISEEIINSITSISSLKVIGRTSSFQFKGKDMDIHAIGEKLNVSFILDGSIQISDNTLRITTQLIRVEDNSTIWSQRFDKKFKDIFAIQDSISKNIVEKLKLTLLASEKPLLNKKETDPEVYSNYLKGIYTYKKSDFDKSITYNLSAIKMDSLFAPPYAYIALAKIWKLNRSHEFNNYNGIREAKEYANKAILLDPTLAESYSALGLLAWSVELDFAEAKLNFEKSIQLNPSSSLIKNRYAYFLLWMGDFDKAEKLGLDAINSDPGDFNGYIIVGNATMYKRKFSEADKIIKEGLKLFPDNVQLKNLDIEQHFYSGDYSYIIQTIKPILLNNQNDAPENWKSLLSIAYFKKDNEIESKKILDQLIQKTEDNFSNKHYSIARIYGQYGEKEKCFQHLEKSYNNRESIFSLFKIDPNLDPIRQDPRYLDLYKRYGFNNYK